MNTSFPPRRASSLQMREDERRVPMRLSDLVVGTICGGSDGTSGIAANPAVGRAFDRLVDAGAICIFEETGEMIGCEGPMATRAASPEIARSEEHTSELQSLMRISYAVFCLK